MNPYFTIYDGSSAKPSSEVLRKYNLDDLPDAKIPRYVMETPDLSTSAKGLYAMFCFLVPASDRLPGKDGISEICSISVSTFTKYRRELEAKGFLEINYDPPFVNGRRHYSLPICRGGINIGCRGYGKAAGAVLTDQVLDIRQKAMYGYLQSLNGEAPPSVSEVAAALNVRTIYVYRNYYILAGFCKNIPARWRDRALAEMEKKRETPFLE